MLPSPTTTFPSTTFSDRPSPFSPTMGRWSRHGGEGEEVWPVFGGYGHGDRLISHLFGEEECILTAVAVNQANTLLSHCVRRQGGRLLMPASSSSEERKEEREGRRTEKKN